MLTHCVLPSLDPSLVRPGASVRAGQSSLLSRATALAASTAIALVLIVVPASADDFIIDGDFTDTNGPFGNADFDGDDNVLVTENGSITTSGADEYGIFADGPDNMIQVDGSVRTEGTGDSQGIRSDGERARITINGSIVAARREAVQIRGANTTVVNNGSITSNGSQGVRFTGDALGGTLINTGTIMSADTGSQGVDFDSIGTLINSGLIMSESSSFEAVDMNNEGGVLENTGTILATGPGAEALFLGGGVIVTNSGRLVSHQAAAIELSDRSDEDDTFNLLAPGFIGGNIDFGDRDTVGTETAINIVTGQSHSIFWTLEGDTADWAGGAPTFSGPVPWFYNAATKSVATFDPTLLASETTALGDLTSLLSRAGLGAVEGFGAGLGSGFSSGDFGALGYLPVDDGGSDPVSQRLGRAWVTALGGQMDHDGGATTLESTIGHFGFAGGYSWQHAPDMILNAMAGYVAGNTAAHARWAPSFDHDTHTFFTGLHGEHQLRWGELGGGAFNGAALQFGLTAGYSHIDHNRFVNDNLAPLGESWVSADYGGFFVSPELALSTDIVLESGQTLTPNAGLRYAAQWLGGYSETGAVSPAANATVEDRFIGTLEARVGLDVTRSFAFGNQTGTLTGRIGYLGRWSSGDDGASIALNGVTQSVASAHQDLNALTVGATLRSELGETAFLELDANYLHGDTAQGFDGWFTVGMAF